MPPFFLYAVTLGVHASERAFVVVKPHVIGYGGRAGPEALEVRGVFEG